MKFKALLHSLSIAFPALFLLGCDNATEKEQPLDYIVNVPSAPVYYGPDIELTPVIGVPAQTQDGQRIFVSNIFDFDYELGTAYELRLVTFKTSDGTYLKVDEIISAEPDPIGTSYIYNNVELTRGSFTEKSSGVFGFFGYSFYCSDEVDCASLVTISQSGGLVEVEFEYTGGAVPITLVRWN